MPKTFRKHLKPTPVTIDGYRFDSTSEGNRYGQLRLLLSAANERDRIKNLVVHPRLSMVINGRKIGVGYLKLDFAYDEYVDGAWRRIYEDHKGEAITPESKVRIQVAEAINDVRIKIT